MTPEERLERRERQKEYMRRWRAANPHKEEARKEKAREERRLRRELYPVVTSTT